MGTHSPVRSFPRFTAAELDVYGWIDCICADGKVRKTRAVMISTEGELCAILPSSSRFVAHTEDSARFASVVQLEDESLRDCPAFPEESSRHEWLSCSLGWHIRIRAILHRWFYSLGPVVN